MQEEIKQVSDERMRLIERYAEFVEWTKNFDFDLFFKTDKTESEVA